MYPLAGKKNKKGELGVMFFAKVDENGICYVTEEESSSDIVGRSDDEKEVIKLCQTWNVEHKKGLPPDIFTTPCTLYAIKGNRKYVI